MKNTTIASFCGFVFAISIVGPSRLMAQAAPGPLAPPPGSETARPVAVKAKVPVIQTRTTLNGAWKLNHDESDDPRTKVQNGGGLNNGNNCDGGYPGGGYPGGGYPRGPMGGPYPGGCGRRGGYPGGQQGQAMNQKLQDLVRPASSLSIALNDKTEVDLTDDQYHKLVLFTDSRQLQKPKDETYQEIAAHWSGDQLVSDEKSPQGAKMSRTFELSQNGRQLYETIHIDAAKSSPAVYLSYVYDIPPPQATHESDPNQPVLKRRSDDSASTSGTQGSGTSDPNQPVLKRRSDDSDDTSATQATQPSDSTASSSSSNSQSSQASGSATSTTPQPPDPDQPVMKRRTDNSSPSQ